MAQSKEYHINNATIRLVFGNILDSEADVIGHSINKCYQLLYAMDLRSIARNLRKTNKPMLVEINLYDD